MLRVDAQTTKRLPPAHSDKEFFDAIWNYGTRIRETERRRSIIFPEQRWLALCEVSVRFRLFVWTLLLFACSLLCLAQKVPPGPPPQRGDITTPMGDEDEARARISAEMAKKAAKERVVALRHDTDKLLKLSVELKEFVDRSDENVLSLDVIKKAEEIEKLAHSVKDKMKGPN